MKGRAGTREVEHSPGSSTPPSQVRGLSLPAHGAGAKPHLPQVVRQEDEVDAAETQLGEDQEEPHHAPSKEKKTARQRCNLGTGVHIPWDSSDWGQS